jgi:predicted O-methyltransferase YrrM
MRFSKQWTTHIPMLIKYVQMTDRTILELGSGVFSTPLLHWLCAEKRRSLITFEDHPEYYEFARQFKSRNHRVVFLDDWDKLQPEEHYSVVFIDHNNNKGDNSSRSEIALRFKDKADYIIIHDSDVTKEYGYENIWSYFKYRYDWTFCKPYTSVLSNFYVV